MGYYVNITRSEFIIPTANLDAALAALKDLNTNPIHDEMKNHDSSGAHYSWMPTDYHEHVESAKDVFEMLGFETEGNAEGLVLTYYDSKTGKEEYFLKAVAHLVAPGSYIEWRGEDGEQWRWDFDGHTMRTRQGRLVFI